MCPSRPIPVTGRLEAPQPPKPGHFRAVDKPVSERDAAWPPAQNPPPKPLRGGFQYSPSASSHTLPCSAVDNNRLGLVVMVNGRSFLSSIWARKMLNAS